MAELDQAAAMGVPLVQELASVPDPRGKNGRRYSAGGLLALVSAAVADVFRELSVGDSVLLDAGRGQLLKIVAMLVKLCGSLETT